MGQDGDDWEIYAQRYGADGAPTGLEFRVNTTTSGTQRFPSTIGLADGGFVMTWMSPDGDLFGIRGQRYDAVGAPVGGEFQINASTAGSQTKSSVTALSDGGFVVTWNSEGQDGDGSGVYGQRFDKFGNPVENEFRLNGTTAGNQFADPSQGGNPALVTLTDGRLVQTFYGTGEAYVRIFDVLEDAAPTTSPVTLTAIAEDSGPRLITQANLLANAKDIDTPAAALTASGLAISSGSGQLVDNNNGTWTYTPAADDDTEVSFTYTILDGAGGSVAGSASLDITPVNDAPRATVDLTPTPDGGDIQANTYTSNDQREPSIAGLTEGGFVL